MTLPTSQRPQRRSQRARLESWSLLSPEERPGFNRWCVQFMKTKCNMSGAPGIIIQAHDKAAIMHGDSPLDMQLLYFVDDGSELRSVIIKEYFNSKPYQEFYSIEYARRIWDALVAAGFTRNCTCYER